MKKIEASKIFFLSLITLLPLNLGKHFEFPGAYVYGKLVDYLVPTLFVQDVLALLLLVAMILEKKKFSLQGPVKKLAWLLIFVFLSAVFASRVLPSFWFVIRIFLYSLVSVYVLSWVDFKKDIPLIQKILGIQLILISILAVAQFFLRGSVFNNYVFLGEQPYNISTPEIKKEVFLGKVIVPPLALFRHPNALSGYLAVMLILVIFWFPKSRLRAAAFFFGLLALLTTFSYFTWGIFFVSPLLFKILKHREDLMYISLFVASLILLIPFFPFSSSNASFYRRDSLMAASYEIVGEYPLLGVGANNFTSFVDDYQKTNDLRFTQPVHNVFALILAESGIFAFLAFIILFFETYKETVGKESIPFFLSLTAIMLLMSFDHYFWTLQQNTLLFFFVLGLSWKYTYGQRK